MCPSGQTVGILQQEEKFWDKRSERFDSLQWVNDSSYLDEFIMRGKFCFEDLILDIGTGTGIVANAVSLLVKEVIGMDISQKMLNQNNWKGNKYFIRRDIRDKFFHDEVFDKITARMVFHHIIDNTQVAMDECYRILKSGGKMILSEGVPPSKRVKNDYIKIFSLKEKRLTFLEQDLVNLMRNSGFKNIRTYEHLMKGFSVRNWLENSGLPQNLQDKIFEMHVTAGRTFKKDYSMKIVNGDCLINVKKLILVGKKK